MTQRGDNSRPEDALAVRCSRDVVSTEARDLCHLRDISLSIPDGPGELSDELVLSRGVQADELARRSQACDDAVEVGELRVFDRALLDEGEAGRGV
ncbi:MAG: hypothetical protein J2P58_14020, partial [Acidimicrobiaceae bacterium]|nr:hypothetical protein [Acidimicrobiaceae bacterium]